MCAATGGPCARSSPQTVCGVRCLLHFGIFSDGTECSSMPKASLRPGHIWKHSADSQGFLRLLLIQQELSELRTVLYRLL